MSRAFNLAMTGNSLASSLPPTPVPTVGAFLSVGSLDLGNPVLQYVAPGASGSGWVPFTGGTLTGPLYLWGTAPGNPNEAAPKSYVDTMLPLSGGTMTGQINLVADPQLALQPATKQYADLRVLRTGDTMTGALYAPLFGLSVKDTWTPATDPDLIWSVRDGANNIAVAVDATGAFNAASVLLTADPSVNLGAATKQYVDNKVVAAGAFLPLAGGTLTGPVTAPAFNAGSTSDIWTTTLGPDLAWSVRDGAGNIAIGVDYSGSLLVSTGTPGSAGAVTSKSYVDTFLSKTGGTMTGTLTLAGDPVNALDAATRNYVDKQVGGPTNYVPLSGGTMTGFLILNADPVQPLGAVTKQYADSLTAGAGGPYLSTKGGTMTGPIGLVPSYGKGLVDATDGVPIFSVVNPVVNQDAILIGRYAGKSINAAAGGGLVAIGYMAGGGAGAGGTTTAETICIGYFTGRSLITGNFNTFVGHNSGGLENNSSNIVAVGNDCMRDSIGCSSSIAIGKDAHRGWDAQRNTIVGTSGMQGGVGVGIPHATGVDNAGLGYRIMRANNTATLPANTVTASRNIIGGSMAVSGDNLQSASDNVVFGYNAAPLMETSTFNILNGSGVVSTLKSGSGNNISGAGAAKSLVSGNNNIIIAAGNATVDVADPAESGTLRIGANAVNTIRATKIDTANPIIFLDGLAVSTSYADDTTAAAAGVALHQLYRSGSQVMVRVA